MLSTLLFPFQNLFSSPRPPTCPGTGSTLLLARRRATDEKYTARPLDFFPNPLVPLEELRKARAEAGVLDEMFRRYKREAACLGSERREVEVEGVNEKGKTVKVKEVRVKGRVARCEGCREWCCNACRFHTDYRIVCSAPLLFSDEVHIPPGYSDHALLAPNKRMQTLQIRLRDHEHPYALALIQQFARRWHGYCYGCLPRVSAGLIHQIDGRFEPCKCERADAVKKWRKYWICVGCFEAGCAKFLREGFEEVRCQGRGCGVKVSEVGWERFQPVCTWCTNIIDAKGMEAAREALREGEGFEVLRKDSRRN